MWKDIWLGTKENNVADRKVKRNPEDFRISEIWNLKTRDKINVATSMLWSKMYLVWLKFRLFKIKDSWSTLSMLTIIKQNHRNVLSRLNIIYILINKNI